MYCPRCGRQPGSNDLRFCSHCGFKLGVVKASLADDEEHITATTMVVSTPGKPPQHRNINVGVVLMFLASVLAILINGRPGGLGREGGGFILTAFFGVILLSSSHVMKLIHKVLSWGAQTSESVSASQREMGFGAALMFLATALSAMVTFLMDGRMKTPTLLIGVVVSFVVLLLASPYVMHALRYLIREESKVPGKVLGSVPNTWSLPSAQEMPLASVETGRVITAEIGVPVASVTEHTTGLLREK